MKWDTDHFSFNCEQTEYGSSKFTDLQNSEMLTMEMFEECVIWIDVCKQHYWWAQHVLEN